MAIKPFGSYSALFVRYGNPFTDPAGFESKWIVTTEHMIGGKMVRFRHNKDVTDPLHTAFQLLTDRGLLHYLTSYDGCFVIRNVRGSTGTPSLHSFGLALDFNAGSLPLGSDKRLPQPVVDCFKAAGFFYGGDFKKRHDPMHFEYTNGVI